MKSLHLFYSFRLCCGCGRGQFVPLGGRDWVILFLSQMLSFIIHSKCLHIYVEVSLLDTLHYSSYFILLSFHTALLCRRRRAKRRHRWLVAPLHPLHRAMEIVRREYVESIRTRARVRAMETHPYLVLQWAPLDQCFHSKIFDFLFNFLDFLIFLPISFF